jgi:hypothetical protein
MLFEKVEDVWWHNKGGSAQKNINLLHKKK